MNTFKTKFIIIPIIPPINILIAKHMSDTVLKLWDLEIKGPVTTLQKLTNY